MDDYYSLVTLNWSCKVQDRNNWQYFNEVFHFFGIQANNHIKLYINRFDLMLSTALRKTKRIVTACDLFRTNELIRYKNNPEFRSTSGGICSIAIIISFTILFTQTIINTFDKKFISSQTSIFEETEPKYFSTQDSPFLFALGISGFNVNHPTIKYFNIEISQRNVINGVKSSQSFTLQPCDR